MRRVILMIAVFAVALALSGCRTNSSEAKPKNASPAQNVSSAENSAPNLVPEAPRDNSKIKLFTSTGTVTKIDLKMVSVELDHEEIKGLMPKMKMEFFVRDKAELETLKLGDRVEFVLEDNAGAERIVSIKKTP